MKGYRKVSPMSDFNPADYDSLTTACDKARNPVEFEQALEYFDPVTAGGPITNDMSNTQHMTREQMRDKIAEQEFVLSTNDFGPGILVLIRDRNPVLQVGHLTKDTGWYVEAFDTGHDEDILYLMPEGNSDD